MAASVGVAWVLTIAAITLVSAERRRAEKFVRATVAIKPEEASAILTAPTWGR